MRILYKPPPPQGISSLEITWDDILNVPVVDPSDVNSWNTFFDLPANGAVFTSVVIAGNMVKLGGGWDISLKSSRFANNLHLISFNDFSGCVSQVGNSCFSGCSAALLLNFPRLLTAGNYSFINCSVSSINCPKLTSAGLLCFSGISMPTICFPSILTVGQSCFQDCRSTLVFDLPKATTIADMAFINCYLAETFNLPSVNSLGSSTSSNDVFAGISGHSITLTVPSALMTCWYGLPDNDIQNLQSNNNVTIIQV